MFVGSALVCCPPGGAAWLIDSGPISWDRICVILALGYLPFPCTLYYVVFPGRDIFDRVHIGDLNMTAEICAIVGLEGINGVR